MAKRIGKPTVEPQLPAVAPPVAPGGLSVQVPEFMQAHAGEGTELLAKFIVPPRLKIVQPQSLPPLSEMFDPGDVVIMPQKRLIAGMEDEEGAGPLYVVPLLFFPEWCQWNPIQLRGSVPAIRGRTFDPNNAIARRARNPETRLEKHPERTDLTMRNSEHLNFLFAILNEELQIDMPVICSFFRGEHGTGANLAAAIRSRSGAPIYGNVFRLHVSSTPRSNAQGKWYGFDISNPSVEADGYGPFVTDRELFDQFAELHAEFAKAHRDNIIRPDYEGDEEPVATTDSKDF